MYCFTLFFKCPLLRLSWELRLESIGYVKSDFLHLCKFTRFFTNYKRWKFLRNGKCIWIKMETENIVPFVNYYQKGIF